MLRILSFRKVQPQAGSAFFQSICLQSSFQEKKKIVLPKSIKRGPTDILNALASTVQRDPTAPHYKYLDDPFLIPTSHYDKSQYTLSMEAGRKAAHFVKNLHPDLFQVSERFVVY